MTPAPVTRSCAKCNSQFEARRPHARFCSARCRVAASRETRNEPPVTQSAAAGKVASLLDARAVTQEAVSNSGDSAPATVRPRCLSCYWRALQPVPAGERTWCEACGHGFIAEVS